MDFLVELPVAQLELSEFLVHTAQLEPGQLRSRCCRGRLLSGQGWLEACVVFERQVLLLPGEVFKLSGLWVGLQALRRRWPLVLEQTRLQTERRDCELGELRRQFRRAVVESE